MNKAKMYHGQADVDKDAKAKDDRYYIPVTSYKAIKEAYDEFMEELALEAQEAY